MKPLLIAVVAILGLLCLGFVALVLTTLPFRTLFLPPENDDDSWDVTIPDEEPPYAADHN
ncbi:MAG: hypothetical protein HY340_00860 [Candidatus Kerfeldbacteria bacterium]|nr:hypothetical protein [Candidatus Kerfeldbacteria bacterium]